MNAHTFTPRGSLESSTHTLACFCGTARENPENPRENPQEQSVIRAQDGTPGAVKQLCYLLRLCATSAVYFYCNIYLFKGKKNNPPSGYFIANNNVGL